MDQLLYGRVFGLPVWVVGLVVIGGGIAAYFLFFRHRSSSSSGTLGQSTQPPIDTSQIDPITGVPWTVEEQTNPNTGLPNYYNNTGNNGTTGPTAPGTSVTATTRGRQIGGLTGSYDAANPQGIPLDVAPGQYESGGFIPYGAQLTITGGPVQGPANNPQLGITTWYPVSYAGQSGYVSAYDLAGYANQTGGFQQPQRGGPINYAGAQAPTAASPNTVYPMAGGGYVSPKDLNGAPHGGAHGPYQPTDFWPIMMDMPVERK